jgi:hypothetical protein
MRSDSPQLFLVERRDGPREFKEVVHFHSGQESIAFSKPSVPLALNNSGVHSTVVPPRLSLEAEQSPGFPQSRMQLFDDFRSERPFMATKIVGINAEALIASTIQPQSAARAVKPPLFAKRGRVSNSPLSRQLAPSAAK